MKTNDLRIGNYIYGNYYGNEDEEKTEKCKVLGIDSVGFSEYPIWVEGLEETGIETYMGFQPIPLTEEWLLKFGFNKQIGFIKFIGVPYEKDSFEVAHNDLDKWYCYFRNFVKGAQDDFVLLRNDLKHVHQLQNLYHALTGEEL